MYYRKCSRCESSSVPAEAKFCPTCGHNFAWDTSEADTIRRMHNTEAELRQQLADCTEGRKEVEANRDFLARVLDRKQDEATDWRLKFAESDAEVARLTRLLESGNELLGAAQMQLNRLASMTLVASFVAESGSNMLPSVVEFRCTLPGEEDADLVATHVAEFVNDTLGRYADLGGDDYSFRIDVADKSDYV